VYRDEHFIEFLCFRHSKNRVADSYLVSDIRVVECFVSVFTVNLSTFSLPLTVQLEMFGWLLNNDFEKTWKQAGSRKNYEEPFNRIACSGGGGGESKFETWTSVMRGRRVRFRVHANGWLTWRFFYNEMSQKSVQCPQNLSVIVLAFLYLSLLLMKITLLIY